MLRVSCFTVQVELVVINAWCGSFDLCLVETGENQFLVSKVLDDHIVMPVEYAENPTYEKYERLLGNMVGLYLWRRSSLWPRVSNRFSEFKHLFLDGVPVMLFPHPERCRKEFTIKLRSPLPRSVRNRFSRLVDNRIFLKHELFKMEKIGMISLTELEYASPCFVAICGQAEDTL